MKSLGIYIHIPVCNSLCGYCDFYSINQSQVAPDFWDAYYEKLKEEFYFKVEFIESDYKLNSIYFGGGTPSLAPIKFLENIIEFLLKEVPRKAPKIEISLEANPETISPHFLNDLASVRINRLSIGVQSMNNTLLHRLDREGNSQNIQRIIGEVSCGPIKNWNADIMYGIPGQTANDLIYTIQTLISYDPKHISAYELTLPEHSSKELSETQQYEHQQIVWAYLPAHGFHQYEISNFCRPGFECLHNLAVWKYRSYLSLGTSGHSFLGDIRLRTVADVNRYLTSSIPDVIYREYAQIIPDLFITGLRLGNYQGNSLYKKLLSKENYYIWEELKHKFSEKGWINLDEKGFQITTEGLRFSNSMLVEIHQKMNSRNR